MGDDGRCSWCRCFPVVLPGSRRNHPRRAHLEVDPAHSTSPGCDYSGKELLVSHSILALQFPVSTHKTRILTMGKKTQNKIQKQTQTSIHRANSPKHFRKVLLPHARFSL